MGGILDPSDRDGEGDETAIILQFVGAADDALSRAKQAGRNRSEVDEGPKEE